MIVNPQLFNYRLIIGSLVIAIVVLGSFSYTSYDTLKSDQEFIEQEKNLVENELSEMISRYDHVDVENKNINLELENSKQKINSILDSVNNLKSTESLVSERKIKTLEKKSEQAIKLADNIKLEYNSLKEQTEHTEVELEKSTEIITDLKVENASLSKTNTVLEERIEKAKLLTITNVKAEGVKRVTSKRIVATRNASRAKQLHVCFTLAKNTFADKGNKDIYIQVLDPRSNIVADKGSISFGKTSLIYTQKTSVEYNNEDVKVCTLMHTDENESIIEGTYFVSIFNDAQRLGKTTIELN